MSYLKRSELILNPDGSVYHLNLRPGDIADTIITVGDPDRVTAVTKHFDLIEVAVHRREFKTQTGTYKGKRLTVISTGIGTDNIDIVFNELDALVNIDFETRLIKEEIKKLQFVRIGTSGAIQATIPVDSFLISEKAIGFDNLIHFYDASEMLDTDFSDAFMEHTNWHPDKSSPYVVPGSSSLLRLFEDPKFQKGCTATNVGFYGPQGRMLRLQTQDTGLNDKLESFEFKGTKITNLEMETSGIYGLALLLGHEAISLNAILANRALGTFSETPSETIDQLIINTLEILSKNG